MKKYLSLILIVVILINFIIFDILEKNRVYAELVITSALSIKLFACILAAMGVYIASTTDYKTLYNKFQESHLGQLNYFGKMVRNLLIHRIVVNVKGRYEFIRDFINSLDFSPSTSYQKVTIEKIGDVTIDHKGIISDGYTVSVYDGYVFSVGDNIIKTVATSSGYNIYTRVSGGGYQLTGGILNNTNEIVFKEDWSDDYKVVYQMYYKDTKNKLYEAGGGIAVYYDTPKPDEDVDPGQTIDIRMKKSTDVVDLPKTEIGVIVADDMWLWQRWFDNVDELINNLDDIDTFDEWYLERLREYDIDYTDVINEGIILENVPIEELENIPAIPGIEYPPIDIPDVDNPDVPIDPSIPIDPSFPIDTPVTIPDEAVLDEPIADDSKGVTVFGLGLITRLLRFIGNILKLAIVTPINIIKSGIIAMYEIMTSIPSYLSNIIDYIKDIPSKLSEIVTGVLDIPTWLSNILDKVSSIPTFLEGVYTDLKEGILSIPEKIDEIREGISEKVEEIKTNVVEYIESLFVPTLELDFEPLKIGTIKDKFPFCLPFDILNIFNQLKTSPEIPKWEVNFLGSSLVLDFSQFETLAIIVRWAIVIIFTISLIKLYSIMFL